MSSTLVCTAAVPQGAGFSRTSTHGADAPLPPVARYRVRLGKVIQNRSGLE